MDEKELGKALLRWDATSRPPDDPREVAARILRRDRRRVLFLSFVTLFLWVIAVAGVCLHFVFFSQFVGPKIQHEKDLASASMEDLPQRVQDAYVLLFCIAKESLVLVSGTVLAVILAGVSSVLLVVASRRATLRQVNVSLRELTEELRRLQDTRGSG
jgi:hypothetical protein